MKNYLLFNQSFGTVGSPNQTGETLTRENRIGLMSYLRRTLMLLFAVLVMSIGQALGATYTWTFDNSGNNSDVDLVNKTTELSDYTSSDKSMSYVGGSSCKIGKKTAYLAMGGASTQSSSALSTRYFILTAPSANGTISVTFAGTASGNELIRTDNGDYQVIATATSTTKVSSLLSGLTAGTTKIYIAFTNKCYISSIAWTDADAPEALTTLYSSDYKSSMESGASISVSSGMAEQTGGSGWVSAYSKYYKATSTNKEATITFSPALSLVSDGNDRGKIRIYYGSLDKYLNATVISDFKINGGSSIGTAYGVLEKEKVHVIEYTIPVGTSTLTTIYNKIAVSNGCLLHVEVLTHSAGGGCTSITPTWATEYSSTTLNVGGTSSTPSVGGNTGSGAVTFSSSDAAIASVNSSTGVVTGVGAGTATITATVAASGDYCSGTVTKSFTIKAGVTYDANSATGGSVPTDDNTYAYNANITVAGNTGSLYKTGFVFNGWNTRSDGTGTHYEAGATMKMPSKSTGVTLYAEWVGYATSWEWWNCGQSNNSTTFTYITSKNYICSFASSASTAVASWDIEGGEYYRGIKIKTKDHSIAFWVQTGKRVSITFGTRPTKPTFTVGGVDKSSDVGASENADSITVTYTTTGDTKFYIENETATNTAFTVKSVKIEDDAPSCTAPNHVDVAATSEAGNYGWRYTIGETMKLTAKAYSTAGTSSEITSGLTYQWKKKTGESTWKSLTDGVDATDGGTFSGTTSANLQVSGCTSSNAGTYKCEVSTGAGCTTTSNEYWVRIFTLDGNYSGEDWIKNPIVWTDEYNGTVTLTNINANSTYKFKVTDNDSHWYGKNTAIYKDQTNYWAYRNDGTDIELHTGIVSGTYTISVDVFHANDVSNPYCTLSSVNYPKRDIYMELCSDWNKASAKFAIYYFRNADSDNDKGWTDLMTTHTCNSSVMHADDVPSWADRYIFVRLNSDATVGTWDKKWNQTGNVTPDASKDYYHTMSGTGDSYSGTWGTIPTYTISFAANGGSGSMSSLSSIACDADQALTANSFTKTGYSFTNWTADVDVTVNDATVSAGSAIANSATIQNIRGNIALTAQWSEDKHSVTVAAGLNGSASPSSVSNIGIATASGDITATANTGYHFTSWTLPSGTSAASTYSESSNPIRINATADGKTITANFSANTPTITLDNQDATNTPTGSVVATYGSSMPEIATLPTKTGYTFGGFYSDVAGGGTKYYTNTGASAKNSDLASATTLYALWTQSVTIDDNGGSADGSVSVTYKGTAAAAPSGMTYAGHTADLGFYTESSCTNKVMNLDGTLVSDVTVSTVPWTNASSKWVHAGSSTLYAHWKCNTPEISCSSNTITISVPSGATVYYTTTTDGSTPADPTSSSTAYNPSSKPTISADTKIKAIAIQSGCTNSAIASANLTYVAAGTSYYLFTPTSAPVHAGVLSRQFVTDASAKSQEKTILEYTFPSYLNGVGTATSMSGRTAGSQGIQYYAKTSTTKFIIYYGVSSSSSTYKICIGRVSEGETSVTSTERSVSANDLDTIQYEFTSTKNTTFSFHINNNNIWIYQIVAIESGTDHKQAGEPGYDLSFNKGRIALDNSSTHTITAEGLTIKSTSNFKYTDATALSLAKNDLSNNQISFTTPASPGDLKLTWSGGQMAFNTSASADGATNITSGTTYSLSGSTKYYLINTGGSASSVTKLQFVTAATTHSVSVAYNGSGSYGTAAAASTTVGEGSTTTITASPETGYQVNSWEVSGTGSSLSDDGSTHSNTTTLTMGTADATVTCTFGAISYTLAWSSNGGSDLAGDYTSGSTAYGASITAPNDPTLSNYTFDGWKTNNDGTGTTAGATMPAANTTYYAAWKQTVTLTTGAQGEGGNQTPYVYLNGTGVSNFTAHTASGYSLQGYYTAGSGGTKVLNADGSFAAANVTDYITSSKWSRTGAAPTLYAQWVAAEDCSTSNFVIKKGDGTEYQGCMESSSYNGTATSFTAGSPTTVGNAKMTISNYDGGIKRPGSGKTFTIVIEPLDGYNLKSVCWAGKVESGETVSYYWDDNSGSATTISAQTTSGTGVTYNAPSSTTKFTASYVDDGVDGGGIWWRNVQVEVCAAGGTTYNVTYDGNDETGGTAPTDASSPYDYGATVTVLGNTGSLEKTNYTFAGWTTNDDGTGSSYVADNTFSITANTTLYAKWTQAVTLNKNGGSTDGSATAVWNATGLTGITHAKPAAGYKLLGYYSASSDGTKVLNSDGSFAATNVTGYITSGKWSRTSATTLYAEYESAGALTWNLIVNSDTTNLSTSTKTSAFTEISTTNMTDAALTGLTYSKGKKTSLTGKISTPAYDAGKYAYVTFKVADGYKFTPSNIAVKVQPVGNGEHKAVKFTLTDGSNTLASASSTKCDGTSDGKTTTVSLAGDGTYFVGMVTLKIYVYPDATASATTYECYRLGTPITIEGEVEEACATMPDYTSMSYSTLDYTIGDTPGAISIVGGENINTYTWKQNTTNDRSGGSAVSTGSGYATASFTPDITSAGTTYYWCEMTNDACGITIKSPAVAITVASAKSDASVTWTDPATPNYGGGGYTIKATVDQSAWNGNASDLTITAPAGIRIYNVSSGTDGSSRKYVQADFDVQTSFDRTTYASNIPFTVSAAATATYNAISDDHNTAYSACAGAGEGSSYNIRMRKTVTKDGNYYHCANTDGWISPNISSSYSTGKAGTTMAPFDTVASSNTQYVWVRTYHANIKKVRIYADFRADNMTVSNVYKHTDYFTANSKYEVDYSVIYNDDEENSDLGDAAQGYVDITLSDVMMSANDILLVSFSTNRVRPLGAVITESSAGSLNTHLQWSGGLANNAAVGKYTTDAYFTYSASMITENTNSLGAITYSSSAPSVATVDATGKVAMVAAGTTTIKATLAASGCYKKAEISYTLNVTEVPCAITAGTLTLTSGTESKCSSANVTLTLTGFESGASIQWKDGDTDINNGGNYTIATDNTTSTSTLTTDQPGTYSVMVTSDCSVRSNRITISNISATASVTKIVDEWYVKNGRLTPDIELWSLSEGATLKSVAWSPTNETGLSCVARGGVIYLEGKSPSSNDSGDIEYTLTATITDECKADHEETTKTIKITHQKNTDKHVLAFVVNGTAKGGFTEGITAAQTTSVGLYNAIAAQFDVQTTNIYATDDEKKLKEYYSQYDILCITDYPNTQTKGANSKSYVDAIGSLIDIRPILTMEAFVSKLANWKAKGISGNPSSPTTRQYTMLLQCKDHEIFAGTELTKVGEGDETMYRVSMVCDTLEDYKTLDATYGATLPHKEKESKSGAGDGEYNYGGKPALQGFTFTQEMSDNDLLPIGLIDDGAGNPLQVGIERQHNMEARLMVLGINSYAMERLTDDGERVVINALNYLMKKNAEDIADCSTSFVGGAEGEEKNWNNKDNWTGNTVPLPSQKVRILAECEVSSTVYALDVLIVTDGKYNHGSDNAAGKLTIKENGALIVGGKIQAASAPAYNRPRATTPDRLLIETSSTNQAALIFDNEEAETQATVNLYSLGSKPSSYQYQYFAVPMEVVPVNPVFANETHGGTGIYTYVYEEASSSWTRRKYYDDLFAFEGLGITTKSTGAMNYTMTGNLASTATKEITLTHDGAGLNLVGNSWMAPIQIGALAEDNTDANITQTAYIYCAGRDAEGGAVVSSDDTETAGQWLAVPFEAAEFETWKEAGKLSVIPAMQAFQIKVDAEATLTLDYDKVVRGSTNDLNAKLRAPGRRMAANEVTMTNIRVADSKTHTDLSLFEGDRFSEAFDNGWEAEYMNGDGRSAKLYAETEAGQMAVAAMYDYEGTVVGFAPGQETEYTFSFMGEDNGYYLNDIKLQNSVRISEGETYTFTYEEGDAANRFYISRTAINAPEVATGMENLDAAAPKVQKIIYNDKLYIIRGGRLYDATGKVVK